MANEIRVTAGLSRNDTTNPVKVNQTITFSADQSTKLGPNPGSISVSTTTTTVGWGSLSNPGWALFVNEGTNPVEIVISKLILNSNQAHVVQIANSATVTINTTTGTSTLNIMGLNK